MFKDARLKRIYGQTLWPYASGNLGTDATKTNRTTNKWQSAWWNEIKWNEMKWKNEWMNGWMNEWMNEISKWHDMTWHEMKWNEMEWNGMEWINEWMNEMNEWMDESTQTIETWMRVTIVDLPCSVQHSKFIEVSSSETKKKLWQPSSKTTSSKPRFPEAPFPDILHSYFSICGLSLCGLLPPLDAMLGMSLAARRRAEARGLLPGTATSTTATTVSGAAEGTSWRRWLLLALLVLAISAWLGAQWKKLAKKGFGDGRCSWWRKCSGKKRDTF